MRFNNISNRYHGTSLDNFHFNQPPAKVSEELTIDNHTFYPWMGGKLMNITTLSNLPTSQMLITIQ
jgi:hypothetical protein